MINVHLSLCCYLAKKDIRCVTHITALTKIKTSDVQFELRQNFRHHNQVMHSNANTWNLSSQSCKSYKIPYPKEKKKNRTKPKLRHYSPKRQRGENRRLSKYWRKFLSSELQTFRHQRARTQLFRTPPLLRSRTVRVFICCLDEERLQLQAGTWGREDLCSSPSTLLCILRNWTSRKWKLSHDDKKRSVNRIEFF